MALRLTKKNRRQYLAFKTIFQSYYTAKQQNVMDKYLKLNKRLS